MAETSQKIQASSPFLNELEMHQVPQKTVDIQSLSFWGFSNRMQIRAMIKARGNRT